MGNKNAGVFRKFIVKRTDGRDGPGQKHHGCAYFVLDLSHDRFAVAAIEAYANVCKTDYPSLSRDLKAWVAYKRRGPAKCKCGARGIADCRCVGPLPPMWMVRMGG